MRDRWGLTFLSLEWWRSSTFLNSSQWFKSKNNVGFEQYFSIKKIRQIPYIVYRFSKFKLLSRVDRRNFTSSPPQNRAWTSRFTRLLSAILLKPLGFKPTQKEISSSQFLVGWIFLRADSSPSLHLHYRDFITTTGWSAPVPRIGTLILMGSPLEFLP